ncbi:MAG: glycosyltransferase family 4 protein [Calditrichaeota bacterium]|nr:glycosyltransferase family 4 protein [Calditrichota bacterium]MCB9365566.1 glycosyltransferase family 4 protein [Calditrichota bacterium]
MRIVITTTLNDNLFRAKLEPLLRSRDDLEVVVVTDRQGTTRDRLLWVWPRGVSRLFGRLGGRFLLLLREVWHPKTRVVMAYNVIPHGFFAALAAKPRGVPVFLHLIAGAADIKFADNPQLSDNRMVTGSKHPERYEKLARWAAKHAAKLFVPGGNTEAFLLSEGIAPDKIVRLHSAVDRSIFFEGDERRNIDVLVSAQLRSRKRPLFTLEVFRRILDARPGTRFCWLGDGPMHDEFEAELSRLNLRDAMEWTTTNDVAQFYRRARVFLLCSVNEGLSLASMEAMSCGMVPVAAECGDMAEVVRSGETGWLMLPESEPQAYAEKVLSLLANEPQWNSYSQNSIELIAREHDFDSAIRAWQDFFRRTELAQ